MINFYKKSIKTKTTLQTLQTMPKKHSTNKLKWLEMRCSMKENSFFDISDTKKWFLQAFIVDACFSLVFFFHSTHIVHSKKPFTFHVVKKKKKEQDTQENRKIITFWLTEVVAHSIESGCSLARTTLSKSPTTQENWKKIPLFFLTHFHNLDYFQFQRIKTNRKKKQQQKFYFATSFHERTNESTATQQLIKLAE